MDAVDVANAFLEARPRMNDDFNELWYSGEGAPKGIQQRFSEEMIVASARPPELSNLTDFQIGLLVAGENQAAANA